MALRQTIRSLAVEAGMPVGTCLERLRAGGLDVGLGAQRLDGESLARARAILDLGVVRDRTAVPAATDDAPKRDLDDTALLVRLLRPLREKGKLGRNKTTALDLVHGHGVPDHQKAAAKAFAEQLLREGALDEKVSGGRRHVWLTEAGLRRLAEAEAAAGADFFGS